MNRHHWLNSDTINLSCVTAYSDYRLQCAKKRIEAELKRRKERKKNSILILEGKDELP